MIARRLDMLHQQKSNAACTDPPVISVAVQRPRRRGRQAVLLRIAVAGAWRACLPWTRGLTRLLYP